MIFSSIEAADLSLSVRVRTTSGLEPFSRDKLFISVYEACRHRKTAYEDATALTRTIIGKLIPLISSAILERDDIAVITAETLQNFDKPAAVQYSAFHPANERA